MSSHILGFALFMGAITVAVTTQAQATQILATYKLSEKTIRCPGHMPARQGCIELTGKAVTGDRWPRMKRIAAVGTGKSDVPAGCVSATTEGVLSGAQGDLRFSGEGYYCPKSNTARYMLNFKATDAKSFSLPVHGVIRYRGKRNRETFTAVDAENKSAER